MRWLVSVLVLGACGRVSFDARQLDDAGDDASSDAAFALRETYVKASNTQANDQFGSSIAIAGDGTTLAVSAWAEDSAATGIDGNQASNAAADAGAVYVFVRSGATWTQQAYVKASNAGAGDNFGVALALSATGDTLAVGGRGIGAASSRIERDATAPDTNDGDCDHAQPAYAAMVHG